MIKDGILNELKECIVDIIEHSKNVLLRALNQKHKNTKPKNISLNDDALSLLFYIFKSKYFTKKYVVDDYIKSLFNFTLQKSLDYDVINLLIELCELFNKSEINIIKHILYSILYNLPLDDIMIKKIKYYIKRLENITNNQ